MLLTGVRDRERNINHRLLPGVPGLFTGIGGETTGFKIKTKVGCSFELIPRSVDQEKLRIRDGQWFEVVRILIDIESVESKERKAIILEKRAVLE